MPDLLIEWTQSPDDPTLSGNVTAYELARDTAPNPVAIVASIPATADSGDTAYQEALQPGSYWYRVRAVDSAGRRSLWSEQAMVQVTSATVVRHRIMFAGALMGPAMFRGQLRGDSRVTGRLA